MNRQQRRQQRREVPCLAQTVRCPACGGSADVFELRGPRPGDSIVCVDCPACQRQIPVPAS